MSDKISPIEVQKYLKGAEYPMSLDQLKDLAESNEAPDEVISFLEKLPEREYDGPNAVIHELKEDGDL